jgi:hypothetical protein
VFASNHPEMAIKEGHLSLSFIYSSFSNNSLPCTRLSLRLSFDLSSRGTFNLSITTTIISESKTVICSHHLNLSLLTCPESTMKLTMNAVALIVAVGLATLGAAAPVNTSTAADESITLCSGQMEGCHTYHPLGMHSCVTFHDFDSPSTTPSPWHLPGVASMTWAAQDYTCMFFEGEGCAPAPYVEIHMGNDESDFQVIVAPDLQSPIQSLRCFHQTLPSKRASESTAVGDTGPLTWDPIMGTALGSCGFMGSPSDDMVSINVADMTNGYTGNPNNNPKCKRTVSITWNGQTHTGYVSDTCHGCGAGGLDLTEPLFGKFDSLDKGVLYGAVWTLI